MVQKLSVAEQNNQNYRSCQDLQSGTPEKSCQVHKIDLPDRPKNENK